jgi:hypothetical protein
MSEIEDVVKEFTEADNAIKAVFPKADPLLVVRLIFDAKAKKDNIYTLEVILKKSETQYFKLLARCHHFILKVQKP